MCGKTFPTIIVIYIPNQALCQMCHIHNGCLGHALIIAMLSAIYILYVRNISHEALKSPVSTR